MSSSISTYRRLAVILFAAILTFLYCRGLKVGQNTANEIRLKSHIFATTTTNSAAATDDIDIDSTPGLRSGNISPKRGSSNDIEIPKCAKQIYLTLQRDNDDDEALPPCHGILIRDDLIITTYKCSQHTYTFHFSGLKKSLKATPHTKLNEQIAQRVERGEQQELGILYANPPYHYHYINQPVRRTRMFLSEITHHANGTDAFITCTDDNKPVAHSFPSDNGELIPISILKDILPSDILWESTDIKTAVTLSYKQYKWYTKPTTAKYEKIEIKSLIKQYCRGPPGSVAFCNGKRYDFNDAAAEAMEALDPRGHRRDCWPYYYDKWFYQEPFSGMKFLDWLDFGPGKFMDGINAMHGGSKCHKYDFNHDKVHYFTDEEREEYEVYFTPSKDGTKIIGRYKHNDEYIPESIDISERDDEDAHHYMWNLNRTMYIVVDELWDEAKYGLVKHTGIVAGQPALAGGEVYFKKNGVLWGIDVFSGHYKPGLEHLSMLYQWMKDEGWPVKSIHWMGLKEREKSKSWTRERCDMIRWHKIEIDGFDIDDLKQSCYELTTSPYWTLIED